MLTNLTPEECKLEIVILDTKGGIGSSETTYHPVNGYNVDYRLAQDLPKEMVKSSSSRSQGGTWGRSSMTRSGSAGMPRSGSAVSFSSADEEDEDDQLAKKRLRRSKTEYDVEHAREDGKTMFQTARVGNATKTDSLAIEIDIHTKPRLKVFYITSYSSYGLLGYREPDLGGY